MAEGVRKTDRSSPNIEWGAVKGWVSIGDSTHRIGAGRVREAT